MSYSKTILAGQKRDIIIIGAGIMGLWAAEYALRAGRKVTVLDKATIGAGASGGLLGALMSHQPVGWSDKKALQYNGLMRLPHDILQLEKETGLCCDYRRPGRLMPIRKESQLSQSRQWVEGAKINWPPQNGFKPKWQTLETLTTPEQWYRHDQAPLGANFDTLAACIDPRKLLAALAASIRQKGGEIIEHCTVKTLSDKGGVTTDQGQELIANQIIITAGYESFPMVAAQNGEDLGKGVKGQSAILKPLIAADPSWPIIYDDGLYLIARPDGTVAIGSTSENDWQEPESTDQQLDALIQRAIAVSPCLKNAKICEKWAGIRPKTHSRVPFSGPIAGCAKLFLITGGFKISLAIAHIVAEQFISQYCDMP